MVTAVMDPVGVLRRETLAATEDSVQRAREMTYGTCSHHPMIELAVWLVSELATNSVLHSGSAYFGLTIARTADGDLRVSVTDEGKGGIPCLRSAGPDGLVEHGRGIWLVDKLAKRWGIEIAHPFGTMVWFTVDKEPPPGWVDVIASGEL